MAKQLQFSDVSIKGMDLKNEADRAIYEYICTNGFITVHQVLDITKITTFYLPIKKLRVVVVMYCE